MGGGGKKSASGSTSSSGSSDYRATGEFGLPLQDPLTTSYENLVLSNPGYEESAAADDHLRTHNCQRCVYAYEMRERGYDVEARDRVVGADDPMFDRGFGATPTNGNFNVYRGMFEGQTWEYTHSGSGINEIKAKMREWGDGSRAVVSVAWKGGGAHTFIAEQRNGKTHFIDPQTGDTDCSRYFRMAMTKPSNSYFGYTDFSRVDNLAPSENIHIAVRPRPVN